MANYIAQMRSNYFRVQNEDEFRRFCTSYRLEVITRTSENKAQRFFGFMADDSIPSGRSDANGDWVETDFFDELSKQLAKDEVAVVIEIGSEKMRYLHGFACAVNAEGDRFELSLSDIYSIAKGMFGVEVSQAEY